MAEKKDKSRARYDAVSFIIETVASATPPATREVPFAPGRMWAFDIAWPDYMVAVEYEGSTWQQGGHNSGMGYRLDIDKYNMAAILGWLLIRVTADMLRDLSFVRPILMALVVRGCDDADPAAAEDQVEQRLAAGDPWEHADTGGK